jgi:DNA-binding beta-propeller fold protein YncE
VKAIVGPSRRAVVASLLLGLVFAAAVARWGTRWTVPSAGVSSAAYSLAAFWTGDAIASGPFDRPIGIAVGPAGDVYVTDSRRRVVRLTATGTFQNEWRGEGSGGLTNPVGVAVGRDGSVYVSDYDQDRVQKFTPEGHLLSAFGNSGGGPGQLSAPAGLAVDAAGSVYVADFYNKRVQKYRADGSFDKTIGHPGRIGPGSLHYPTGLSVTPSGRVLVADAYNYQLQWFDGDGRPVARIGYHLFWLWPRPSSSTGGFNAPTDAASGSDGRIHVADSGNHRIVMLTEKGEYLTDWTIPDANPNVYSPEHIAVSRDEDILYATDFAANRILVLRFSKGGIHGGRSD